MACQEFWGLLNIIFLYPCGSVIMGLSFERPESSSFAFPRFVHLKCLFHLKITSLNIWQCFESCVLDSMADLE